MREKIETTKVLKYLIAFVLSAIHLMGFVGIHLFMKKGIYLNTFDALNLNANLKKKKLH